MTKENNKGFGACSGIPRLGLHMRRFFSTSLLLVIVLSATPLLGQQFSESSKLNQKPEKERRVIEEVLVSAQKVEEVSQKVPISMSVITEKFIAEQGITDIEQALAFTPNFEFDSRASLTGIAATPRCRGFGVAGDNAAFEPPCGVAVDGVAYTRSAWFSASLFDTKRLEVLRGPQGTTFGKNTTAGLVSMVTNDPSEELTANVNLQYNQEGRRRIEGGVGGTLIPDMVRYRFAVLKQDERGFVENTAAALYDVDRYTGAKNTKGLRAKIELPNLFGSQLKFTHETVEIDATGQLIEFDNLSDEAKQWARQYDPNADFIKGNYVSSLLPPVVLSPTEIDRTQLDWEYDIRGWGVDFVASIGEIVSNRSAGQGIVVPSIPVGVDEENEAKTLELRSLSPSLDGVFGVKEIFGIDLGESDLIFGVYHQKLGLDVFTAATIFDYTIAGQIAATEQDTVTPPWEQTPQGMLGEPEPTETLSIDFEQRSETNAAFARLRWYPTEKWLLQVGMRYSEESKSADWVSDLTEPAPIYTAAFGSSDYTASRAIDDSAIQPKFTIGFSPTDNLNFYFHWTRAYKAGGFISFTSQDPETSSNRSDGLKQELDYKREVATEWGADAKLRLLEGAMQLNISVFNLEIEDFQVFTTVPPDKLPDGTEIPGTNYFTVINAAKARARGVEADLTWLPNNWLSLVGTLGYNDTEFLDFPIYPCGSVSNNDGDDDPRCDASGQPFERTPKWNNTLTADIRFPVMGEYEVFGGATLSYKSKMFYGNVLLTHELAMRPSSYDLQAKVGFANPERGWSFQVVAKNVTDKTRYTLEALAGASGITQHIPEAPRTVYAQFLWRI